MTYKVNGVQYWRRNGVCCSWTKEEGRKVIPEEVYLNIVNDIRANKGATKPLEVTVKEEVKPVEVAIDPKSKVEIAYQEVNKNDRIVNKKKVVTYGNLDKVIANMEAKDNFVKILGTRNL